MPRKSNKTSRQPKQPLTPEQELERLRKRNATLEKHIKLKDGAIIHWMDKCKKRQRETEAKQDTVNYWRNLFEIQQNTIGNLQKTINIQQQTVSKHIEDLVKDREDKLIAHGLISGKSKVLTKCDACKFNGDCKYQEICQGRIPPVCTGPYPMDADDQIRIAQFPLNLVAYWEDRDLKN